MDDQLKQLLARGREHYERREFDRAEPILLKILDLTDQFADVYNMLGVILHERGNLFAAERYLQRATELNPHYTEALINLAVTYNDLGKYDEAQATCAKMASHKSSHSNVGDPFVRGKIANMHADVAQAYVDAGDTVSAIEELKKAVNLCPTFADLHVKLASCYVDSGQLDSAKTHYETACKVNPSYIQARLMLGVTLLSLGQVNGAIDSWNQVLSLEPDNKKAKMYLRMANRSSKQTTTAG